MIYIKNTTDEQVIMIPTNDTNVEYVNFVPQEGDSDYYTKEQTNKLVEQSRTAVLGEVGDWLSHYPTTDQMHDAIENVTVDLTGYATEDWVEEQDYATKQYVDDAVADIPAGGGIEPFIVEVDSIEPITKTDFNQLFESYSQGIPSYIQSNITTIPQLIPVVGIEGNPNSLVGMAKMWVINGNNLIEYTRDIFGTTVTHTTIPLGGSGDGSGVKVYEAEWDNASGQYTRVTNQMVSDMYDDYSNGLNVQLYYNNMLLTVYFAKEEAPYYYVYVLSFNVIAEFIGYSNFPSADAIIEEYPLVVTRGVFDRAIPHKYDYTITDGIALTGYFSQGNGNELFNDVRDGADVNFKLIIHDGQTKLIPLGMSYDRNMDKVNFLFLDYGRYIMCVLESNGDMVISTENFN